VRVWRDTREMVRNESCDGEEENFENARLVGNGG